MVTFNPPTIDSSYEVELGRQFSLSCMFNRNIYPTPVNFDVFRASGGMCDKFISIRLCLYCHVYVGIHYIFLCFIVFCVCVSESGILPVSNNILNVIITRNITLSDADVYYCQGLSGAEQFFRVGAQVTVRGKIKSHFFQRSDGVCILRNIICFS